MQPRPCTEQASRSVHLHGCSQEHGAVQTPVSPSPQSAARPAAHSTLLHVPDPSNATRGRGGERGAGRVTRGSITRMITLQSRGTGGLTACETAVIQVMDLQHSLLKYQTQQFFTAFTLEFMAQGGDLHTRQGSLPYLVSKEENLCFLQSLFGKVTCRNTGMPGATSKVHMCVPGRSAHTAVHVSLIHLNAL